MAERVLTNGGIMVRVTDQEAYEAALKAANTTPDSFYASALRDSPREFFDGWRTLNDEELVTACTYIVVRGGAVVLRPETNEERAARQAEHDSVNYG